jgi:hypothetical protein
MADEPIEVIPENVAQQVLGAEPTVEPKEELEVKPAEEESRYQKRIDQLTRARREAEERAIRAEERARMMEQQRFAAPSTPAVTEDKIGEMTREKWEEWHAENPVDAMRYLSRAEGRAEAEKVKAETMTQIGRASAVQETVSEVYKAHPELKEVMEGRKSAEEVPFWQVYDEVAREMPDARFLVKGPLLVMREAERRVKEKDMAERERKISGEAALKENERQEQVNAGHTAGASPRPPSAGSVKLSPEEERIARKLGMSPEEYAKNKGGK